MGVLANIRNDYNLQALEEKDLKENPLDLTREWLQLAIDKQVYEPTAMVLSTVGMDMQPDSRIVLLKDIQTDGFVFFTNYESAKGKQIAANAKVSLLLFWKELERQVRIEGVCEKISEKESVDYFNSRPVGSRIGAIVSPQSRVIPSREFLEDKVKEWTVKSETELVKPSHWGGYLVKPTKFEFWQGRTSRLHDRFQYSQLENSWKIERLAP